MLDRPSAMSSAKKIEQISRSVPSYAVDAPQAIGQLPVASLPAGGAPVAGAGAGSDSRMFLFGGGAIAIGLAGFATWQLRPAPKPPAQVPTVTVAPASGASQSSSADAARGSLQSSKADRAASPIHDESLNRKVDSTPSVPGVSPPASKVELPKTAPQAPDVSPGASLAVPSPGSAWSEKAASWALVAVAVAGVAGVLWFCFGRPPPPPDLSSASEAAPVQQDISAQLLHAETSTRPSSSGLQLGPADASVKARQAAEVVFENAPKEGQACDMSASVRGIAGGVSDKVGKLQK